MISLKLTRTRNCPKGRILRGDFLKSTGEIRNRWGEKDRTGPTSTVTGILSSSVFPGARNGLDFFYTNDKHIIVPGLAGSRFLVERVCVMLIGIFYTVSRCARTYH